MPDEVNYLLSALMWEGPFLLVQAVALLLAVRFRRRYPLPCKLVAIAVVLTVVSQDLFFRFAFLAFNEAGIFVLFPRAREPFMLAWGWTALFSRPVAAACMVGAVFAGRTQRAMPG